MTTNDSKDALATSASALACDEASVLTDEQIAAIFLEHRENGMTHTGGINVQRDLVRDIESALLAASSAVTVSYAAGVLTDEQIEAVWDAVDATDIDVNDRKLAVKLRLRFARAIIATSQAATTAGTQDQRAAFDVEKVCEAIKACEDSCPDGDYRTASDYIRAVRAASSAKAPLTSDSDAPTKYDPRDPGNWRDGDDAMGNYRAQPNNGEQP
ncbi:hypothetical protein ACXIVK_24200 [Paraburkholderia caledonica]